MDYFFKNFVPSFVAFFQKIAAKWFMIYALMAQQKF